MLKKIVDGKEVTLSPSEEEKVRAQWAQADSDQAQERLESAKIQRISELRSEAIDALISAKIDRVKSSTTIAQAKAVK